MTSREQLEDLRAGRAPLALMNGQAVAQALRLRKLGLSYSAIATVMEAYHGVVASDQAWRWRLRSAGAPPLHFGASKRCFASRS